MILAADSFDAGFTYTANGFAWTEANRVRAESGAAVFPYGPNPVGSDSTAELRFQMPPLAEFAVGFGLRVPANYVHRADEPSNNKLFACWHKDYNATSAEPHVALELVRGTWAGRPADDFTSYVRIASAVAEPCESRQADKVQYWGPPLITAQDRGQRVDVVIHVRAQYQGSAVSVTKNGTLVAALPTDYSITCPAWDGMLFRFGYVMGWSNSGFATLTEFKIEDFWMADLKGRTFTYAGRTYSLTESELARADVQTTLQAKIDAEEAKRPITEQMEIACRYDATSGAYAIGPADGVAALWPTWPVPPGLPTPAEIAAQLATKRTAR